MSNRQYNAATLLLVARLPGDSIHVDGENRIPLSGQCNKPRRDLLRLLLCEALFTFTNMEIISAIIEPGLTDT